MTFNNLKFQLSAPDKIPSAAAYGVGFISVQGDKYNTIMYGDGNKWTPLNFNPSTGRPNLMATGDSRIQIEHPTVAAPLLNYRFNNGVINKAQSLTRELYNWRADFNSGVSGDTSQGVQNRVVAAAAAIMAKRPASEEWDCVYWVDINDAIASIPANTFLTQFKTTMLSMMPLFRNIYVLSGLPWGIGYLGETANQHAARVAFVNAYNAGMSAFCAQYPQIVFIDSYNICGGGTTYTPVDDGQGAEIHQGAIQADRCAQLLAGAMISRRGENLITPGTILSPNAGLVDIETIVDNGTTNSFYCSVRNSGVLTTRTTSGALRLSISALDNVARSFNIFNNTTSWAADIMPGDELQGCIELEVISTTGLPDPIYGKIQEQGGSNFSAMNNLTAGYGKGMLTGMGRQVFMSDPFKVPNGKAGKAHQPFLTTGAARGTAFVVDIYEVSCRRIYVSPNAEYSAAATVPMHRTFVKCLTTTAAAGFTLTLPPIYNTPDGLVIRFQDFEGNASVKNVTIKGNGSENIKPLASANTNTVVLNTNNFVKAYRCDQGANAWMEM
jgi:hypothetical protein